MLFCPLRLIKQCPRVDKYMLTSRSKFDTTTPPPQFMWTGMGWKITMLILSSLALVLGTVILILNVYSNRWKPNAQHTTNETPVNTGVFLKDFCRDLGKLMNHCQLKQLQTCFRDIIMLLWEKTEEKFSFLSLWTRRRKVVCVLKSYTPRLDGSVSGSPVSSERAPLTEHAMRLPRSSPTLQRGEILIEWKDGTVTPLYEAWAVVRLSPQASSHPFPPRLPMLLKPFFLGGFVRYV